MKKEDSHIVKQFKLSILKHITRMEAELIDNKQGSTNASGMATYEFMLMMHDTKKLLAMTTSLDEQDYLINMNLKDNPLTIGDIK